jgi:hypothetical protein
MKTALTSTSRRKGCGSLGPMNRAGKAKKKIVSLVLRRLTRMAETITLLAERGCVLS